MLIDLHRHICGSIPLADDRFVVKDREPDLMGFLAKLDASKSVTMPNYLWLYHSCHAAFGLTRHYEYVEYRFSPHYMTVGTDMTIDGVMTIVTSIAAQYSNVRLIGIMSRTFGPDQCRIELEGLLKYRHRLVAIDLAGDERVGVEHFKPHFKDVRDAGLAITIHAGEAGDEHQVWGALEMGATRIGHGCIIATSPSLLQHCRNHRIGIECCITSNYQTSSVLTTPHPWVTFEREGVLFNINTDDPAISGITLESELLLLPEASRELALTNAREMAFDL